MSTISDIQNKLKQFNKFAKTSSDPSAYQSKWKQLFHLPLSSQSANSFAQYYKDMRSKTRRSQRGGAGAIQGAPLEYTMVPGLNIQAYGRFPIEAGTDPASVRDLDVYFRDSLTADCGVKDSSLHVPANMGSNQVGGARRHKSRHHKAARGKRHTLRRKAHKGRKGRRGTYRQRGGDLLESITARAPFVYNSTVSPSLIQQGSHAWSGSTQAVPAPADPTVHTWDARTNGLGGIMNPGLVAYVPSDVGRLANPAPWMSSQ
jgi:hypothetical protein